MYVRDICMVYVTISMSLLLGIVFFLLLLHKVRLHFQFVVFALTIGPHVYVKKTYLSPPINTKCLLIIAYVMMHQKTWNADNDLILLTDLLINFSVDNIKWNLPTK